MRQRGTDISQASHGFSRCAHQRRVVVGRRCRPRLPRAAIRPAGTGTGPRAVGADLTAARQPVGSAPSAVGNTRDRRPEGRTLRGLHEDAPRAGRRSVRTYPSAAVVDDDTGDTNFRAPWSPAPTVEVRGRHRRTWLQNMTGVLKSVAGSAPSMLRLARAALLEQQMTLPFGAPRTMLNIPIGERGGAPRSRGRWTGSRLSRARPG